MGRTNNKKTNPLKIIDCRRLIAEVSKRPLLFNIDLPEYGDKYLKNRHWFQVTETITNNWEELSKENKNERVRQIQMKWKSLRDCFQRDRLRCKNRSDYENCNFRRYIYYDDLKFLLLVRKGRSKSKKNSTVKEKTFESVKFESDSSEEDSRDPLVETGDPDIAFDLKPSQGFEVASASGELNVSNMREDEDMLFFYSLMPDYKKFSKEQKYRFKMGVLDLMRREVANTSEKSDMNDFISIGSQFIIKPPED